MAHRADAHEHDTMGHADVPIHVTLTTDHVTADAAGPPLPLARLVVPATASAGVAPALAAALGGGERPVLAMLQLKAEGVFISVRGCDPRDLTAALDALPAPLARLNTRREERRLVYAEGA